VHTHMRFKQTRHDMSVLHVIAVACCIAHGIGKKHKHDRTCGHQHHVSFEDLRVCGQHVVLCCSISSYAVERITL